MRDWLRALPKPERQAIGREIRTVQFGWPVGMPVVGKLENRLWEIRVTLDRRIARVIFTLVDAKAVLLHGFIKKRQRIADHDLQLARTLGEALASRTRNGMKRKHKASHIGSSFESFLAEQDELEEATVLAVKRVLTWELAREMKRANVSRAELARRMRTSRAVIHRLLDETDPSVTLATISRAATALGRSVRLRLAAS